jgi:predicted DNA-binding WGR domain protein
MASDQFPDLSTAIASAHLICVDGRSNHNKFWQGYVLPDGTLYAKYGRVNYRGQTHSYSCGSVVTAQNKLQQLVGEKRAKGYVEAELERASNQTLNFAVLGNRAEEIKAQIRQLEIDAAIVHQHTSIQFNPEKGQYLTQFGIITTQTIALAQTALDQIVTAQRSRSHQILVQAIEAYLRLIPLTVGIRLKPEELIGNSDQVQIQRQVLQTVEVGLNRVSQIRKQIQKTVQKEHYISQTERSRWVTWGEEVSEIQTEFNDTRSDCISWT